MANLVVTLPQPVLFVLQVLHRQNWEGYIVGGAVRDVLLGRVATDWDFTTNAPPDQILQLFPGSFYDNRFGTVGLALPQTWALMEKAGWQVPAAEKSNPLWQNEILDITTYRTEANYSDQRRPDSVAWGNTLEADLSRRDFTVNAMAIRVGQPVTSLAKHDGLDGQLALSRHAAALDTSAELIDLYGGREALDQGVIRTVRDPNERFQEDALRMLRAIRIAAQLKFAIAPLTLAAIQTHAASIKQISWERIRDELLKILASEFPAEGIRLLFGAGLLEHLLPELLATRGVRQAGRHLYDVWNHSLESLNACPSPDPIVRLATLLHDVGKPATYREQGPRGVTFYGHEVVGARIAQAIGRRLRLSKPQCAKIYTLVRWHMFTYNPEMTDAAIRRFIRHVGLENINDMLLLRVGDRKGGGSRATSWRLRELQERIGGQLYEPMNLKDLKIDGTDIMQTLKLKPGPEIGRILNLLFEEVLEDTGKNTRDYLLDRARAFHLAAKASPSIKSGTATNGEE